jgi:hypothetical protein
LQETTAASEARTRFVQNPGLGRTDRLIFRRVHLHAQDDQVELFTYWRHRAFITNRTEPIHDVDAEHPSMPRSSSSSATSKTKRSRISPPGHYSAKSAWTVIAGLAHNLSRWTNLLGLSDPTPRAAATSRWRLFALPD